MFSFDPTIKLGDLLTVASFLGVGLSAFYKLKGNLEMHNLRLNNIEVILKNNSETMKIVATQNVEIQHIKDDIRELKHGEGFVFPLANAKPAGR